jgi:hypothetical protein
MLGPGVRRFEQHGAFWRKLQQLHFRKLRKLPVDPAPTSFPGSDKR